MNRGLTEESVAEVIVGTRPARLGRAPLGRRNVSRRCRVTNPVVAACFEASDTGWLARCTNGDPRANVGGESAEVVGVARDDNRAGERCCDGHVCVNDVGGC